jgi:tetratricopeptide (TPR) repeat protein
MFVAAAEAWKRQDYQQTIDILERGSRLDPANASLLLDLGRAYGMRYDYEGAERCFEKAIRVATQQSVALIAAGQRSREIGRPEMARRYLERAAEQRVSPEILVALAEIHERHHRVAEAGQFVERALKENGTYAPAQLFRARLDRIAGQLEEAEKRLRAMLARTDADTWTRVQGWYELGGILDRQKRFDEAWEGFLEAKSVLRPSATQAIAALQGVQARVREMEETISAEVLHRWSESGAQLQPSRRFAVLCGHPRSGTTLLEQVLDSHPDIVAAEETHILHDEAYLPLSRGFSPEASVLCVLESSSTRLLEESRENYYRYTELFLGRPVGGRLLVDKNPALNVLIPAVIRIFPEAKFIVAIRDPRDVCLSCFMQPLTVNPVSSAYLSFETTVTQFASVMSFWQVMLTRMQNPFIEVRYEELVNDLEATSRRVLEFLGVAWDERVLRFDEHARTKLVRSPTYAEVTKPVFKSAVGRWRNYERYLSPWLGKLDPFVNAFGYGCAQCGVNGQW